MKKIAFFLLDFLGFWRWALAAAGSRTILVYHGVSSDTGSGIFNYRKKFIQPRNFENQLRWLWRFYTIVPLNSLLETADPGRRLAITFDDGYVNNYTEAFPILKRLNTPATVFLTTALVGNESPLWVDRIEYAIGHAKKDTIDLTIDGKSRRFPIRSREEKEKADDFLRTYCKQINGEEKEKLILEVENQSETKLRLEGSPYEGLAWDYIREMEASGLIHFAPHTKTHPILSHISPDEARIEINESNDIIKQKCSQYIPVFAYPNGQPRDITVSIIETLKAAGLHYGLTTVPGSFNTIDDPYAIKRITMDATDDMRFFRLTASGLRARLVNLVNIFRAEHKRPEEFFHETADPYLKEYSRATPEGYSFRERKRLTLQMLGNTRGKRVLDVGSGPGVIIGELLDQKASVTAVDLAPGMTELLKKRFQSPRLAAEVGDIQHLRFSANAFNMATALGVLEYLKEDASAMRELHRVLDINGQAIISFPNYWSPWRVWNRILVFIFGFTWRGLKRLLGKEVHPLTHREYKEKEIRRLAASTNFEIQDLVGYNFRILPFPLDKLLPGLTNIIADRLKRNERNELKWLATAYLVRFKKIN
ncbi:MAG: polysaccharide deacetylase family protein [Candidatus Sungbacteria bacterium]|uniref:Polysaccharide deacetylase family protein n=1 Tax=Candidatus Sungiibacteriota bacterium TaxID=2750080 RepID=A0A9D6LMS0_9BACT|nr:polysaccharide deacetylase family protein [Candidatus Sungbacteria bacterium]